VALRIIVDREREIEKFVAEEYWTMEAELAAKDSPKAANFRASLVSFTDGTKLNINNQEKSEALKKQAERCEMGCPRSKSEESAAPAGAAVHYQHVAAGSLVQITLFGGTDNDAGSTAL